MKEKKRKTEKKNDSGKNEVENTSIIISIPAFNEDDIRKKANEIYNYRMDFGIIGNAEDDWKNAEAYFRSGVNA